MIARVFFGRRARGAGPRPISNLARFACSQLRSALPELRLQLLVLRAFGLVVFLGRET